jgi:hypothetical protein
MKKSVLIGLIALALVLVVCESNIEINLSTIKVATSNTIRFESGLLGSKNTGLLTISWRWAIAKPEVGDGILIERSPDNSSWVAAETIKIIDTMMTYKTSDSAIVKGGTKQFFKLNYLNGANVQPFDTVEINFLPYISFVTSATDTTFGDSLPLDDTLTVTFRTTKNKGGVVQTSYKVEIYRGKVSTNVDSVLNLVNPLEAKDVTTGGSDSVWTCYFPVGDTTKYPRWNFYTIKVNLKTPIVEAIPNKALTLTDNALGFRALIRK